MTLSKEQLSGAIIKALDMRINQNMNWDDIVKILPGFEPVLLVCVQHEICVDWAKVTFESGLKPSHFISHPWDSIKRANEWEVVARNAMVIRERLGNFWHLTRDQYVDERRKDGSYTNREDAMVDEILDWTSSPEQCARFSPNWKKVIDEHNTNRE